MKCDTLRLRGAEIQPEERKWGKECLLKSLAKKKKKVGLVRNLRKKPGYRNFLQNRAHLSMFSEKYNMQKE